MSSSAAKFGWYFSCNFLSDIRIFIKSFAVSLTAKSFKKWSHESPRAGRRIWVLSSKEIFCFGVFIVWLILYDSWWCIQRFKENFPCIDWRWQWRGGWGFSVSAFAFKSRPHEVFKQVLKRIRICVAKIVLSNIPLWLTQTN